MAFTAITKPAVGEPVARQFASDVIDDLNDLNARVTVFEGSQIRNGGFELPVLTATDTTDPTAWTAATGGTGVAQHIISASRSGKQAWKASVPAGSDTVTLTSDDYLPIPEGRRVAAVMDFIASNAEVQVDVDVYWWYWTGSAYSAATSASVTIYSAATNPTSWTRKSLSALAPGGANPAEFYTVKLSVANTSASTSVIFDCFEASLYHGPVALARTLKSTITASSTTTIDISAQIGEESATWAHVDIECTTDTISGGNYVVTVQGWVNGAWATITTIGRLDANNGVGHRLTVHVPLNLSNQFRVVTTSMAGSDSIAVYVNGYVV